MEKKHVIGVDVSKETLDLVFSDNEKHLKISNDEKGFKKLMWELKKTKIPMDKFLFVMEFTGHYSYPFEHFLSKKEITFAKVPAMEIKFSNGVVRGKNDKIDARQIASFGVRCPDKLRISVTDKKLNYLKGLLSLRDRLVKQRAGFKASIAEQKRFFELRDSDILLKTQAKMINQLDKEIEKVETVIKQTINEQQSMKENYQIITSVKSVGFVLGAYMLVWTKNFTCFNDARKFACYSGIAPFDHSSGKSLKKRPRVSQLANKKAKTLLSLAARIAIQHDQELKSYYQRRIESGKNKTSTLNIVSNKLVYRIFAVVKRRSEFQSNYSFAA